MLDTHERGSGAMKNQLLRRLEQLKSLQDSSKGNKSSRLSLENLEDRLAPAIDIAITATSNLATFSQNTVAGVTTLTATTTGCQIGVDLIGSYLAAGNDVVINNSAIILPVPEAGKITWTSSTLNLASALSGTGQSITITQDPSTTTGSIFLGVPATPFITGNNSNNVDLILNPAGSPPAGIAKIGIGGDNSGIQNLTVNSKGSGLVQIDSLFTAINNINITANTVRIGDSLGVDGLVSTNGSINFTGSQMVFENADSTLSAANNILITGNLAVTSAGNTLTLVSPTVNVTGSVGDSTGTLPFGLITINSQGTVATPGSVTFNGSIGVEGFVSALLPPGGNAYNLSLLGGGLFTGTAGNATKFDTLGTITLGNSLIDLFVFDAGLNLTVASPRVGGAPIVNATLATPGQTITLVNAALVNDVSLDTTNGGSVPTGGAIVVQNSVTTSSLSALTINAGTAGNIVVNKQLSGSVSVEILNSNTTVFGNSVTLANLTVFDTTSTVTFAGVTNLGGITLQPGQGFAVQFANSGTLNGAITGSEVVRKTGTGTFTIAAPSPLFTGSFEVTGGTLVVNASYLSPATVFNVSGGTLAGNGTLAVLNSLGVFSHVISPGNNTTIGTLTVNDLNLTDSATVQLQLAGASNDRIITSTQPTLNGARLSGSLLPSTFVPKVGQQFTILQNNSSSPVLGIFSGLPEGGTTQIGDYVFSISYLGGSGNDVVLTAVTGILPPGPVGDTANQHYVGYLYYTLLGRAPDGGGLAAYSQMLDAGASRESVAASIYNSPEQRYNQVAAYYRKFLGRNGSVQEVQGFVNSFLNGATENQVISTFLLSDEYQIANPPINLFITGLYNSLLNRAPDAEGLASYSQALRSGVTREAVVLSFLNSTEYCSDQVSAEYLAILGRAADPSGLGFWTGQMQQNGYGAMVIGLASSQEAFNRAQTTPVT